VIPTMHLRFVKRRVGKNVVRILQQLWQDVHDEYLEEWRDVELAEDIKATVYKSLTKAD
jgi:hypothetical protein